MTQERDFKKNTSSYYRKTEQKTSSNIFLIVTEGKNTEPHYFKAIREYLKLHTVEVEIVHPDYTDPVNLTKEAIRLCKERKKAAKTDATKLVYDQAWVVYDLEGGDLARRNKANDANQMKEVKQDKIKLVASNPSFEFWLLLYFEYTTKPFNNSDEVEKYFKNRHISDYSKGNGRQI